MKKIIFAFALFFSGFAQSAQLVDVKSKEAANEFSAEFIFDGPVQEKNFDFKLINQTIQVQIKNVAMGTPTRLDKVRGARVKSIYSYRHGSDLQTRIIYKKPFEVETFKEGIEVSAKGNSLTISVKENVQAKVAPLPVVIPTDIEGLKKTLRVANPIEELKEEFGSVEKVAAAPETALAKSAVADVNKDVKPPLAPPAVASAPAESSPTAVAATGKLADEKAIPVLQDKKANASAPDSPYSRLFLSLGVVIVFSASMFFATRYWAKFKKKDVNNPKISMLTQFHIGPKKSLAIVRVAGEYILIGITDHAINPIKTLSLLEEEVPVDTFQTTLNRSTAKEVEKQEIEKQDRTDFSEDWKSTEVNFNLSQITDAVSSKLKTMRRI